MRLVRPTLLRTACSLALAAATAAIAFALRPLAPVFLAFAALAALVLALPFLEWVAPPQRLRLVLPRASALVLLLVAILAWFSRSLSGIIAVEPWTLTLLGSLLLVPVAGVFALAPRSFPPGRTLFPATIGLIGLAGLDPAPAGYGGSRLPFLAGADHSAFAELFLAFALTALLALWTAALLDSGPRWRIADLVGLIVAATLVLVLASTAIVGLPLLQPRVERAVASALEAGETGLANESTLGEFAELSVSRRRVLDLRLSRDDGRPWLLRSEVFACFDGRRWTNQGAASDTPRAGVLEPATEPPEVGPLLADFPVFFRPPAASRAPRPTGVEMRITQQRVSDWPLLLPAHVFAVAADAPFLELDARGLLRRPSGIPVRLYGAVLARPGAPPATPPGGRPPESATLSASEGGEASRAEDLALPPRLDPRVRALAGRLAARDAAPRERLQATIAHLRSGYRYTLRPGVFRTADPLAEFLFLKREGYCEYFASAAVVLLRLQGVRARFVKGLSVGPQTDQGGGLHVVRESDAHAWVEAWLPGEGWVEADPTPADPLASARARAGWAERALQHLRAGLASAWERLVARGPLAFLRALGRDLARLAAAALREPRLLVAAAALAIAPRLVRAWRRRVRGRRAGRVDPSATVPPELRALVRELERGWRESGRLRPASRGLQEHARAPVERRSRRDPEPAARLESAALGIVDAYYRVRFGGGAPRPEEIARLREEWERERARR